MQECNVCLQIKSTRNNFQLFECDQCTSCDVCDQCTLRMGSMYFDLGHQHGENVMLNNIRPFLLFYDCPGCREDNCLELRPNVKALHNAIKGRPFELPAGGFLRNGEHVNIRTMLIPQQRGVEVVVTQARDDESVVGDQVSTIWPLETTNVKWT